MELFNEDINELSKEEGFDGIALKVICQGRKGQIGTFSTYVSILFSSTEVLTHFLAQSSFNWIFNLQKG